MCPSVRLSDYCYPVVSEEYLGLYLPVDLRESARARAQWNIYQFIYAYKRNESYVDAQIIGEEIFIPKCVLVEKKSDLKV